ncbi:MAG: hypothetical protein E5X77_25935 [Mesorhizobium sp.]|nr:MAG: hypothetical protein E5X77_25935 [Mesorhizobium sp.]
MAAAVAATFAAALVMIALIIACVVTLVALVRAGVDAIIVPLFIFSGGLIIFLAARGTLLLIVLHRCGHLIVLHGRRAVIGACERRLRRQNAEQRDRSRQQQGKSLHYRLLPAREPPLSMADHQPGRITARLSGWFEF